MSTPRLDNYFDALRTEAVLPERTLDELTARAARGEIVVPAIPSVAAASVFSVPVISVMIVAVAALVGIGLLSIADDSATTTVSTATTTRPVDPAIRDANGIGGEVESVDSSTRRRADTTSRRDDSLVAAKTSRSARRAGRVTTAIPSQTPRPSSQDPRPSLTETDISASREVPYSTTSTPLVDAPLTKARDLWTKSGHAFYPLTSEDTLPSAHNLTQEASELSWQRINGYDVASLTTLNSIGDDFNLFGVGPSYFFLSDRSVGGAQLRMWGTTSAEGASGPFTTPGPLAETINAPGTEINGITSTPGGFVLIIAVTGRPGSAGGFDLFEAERVGGEWKNLVPLTTINTSYTETDPALSADGDTLFFISNRPGGPGIGDDDIWMSVRSPGGLWGAPVILPEPINTPMREASPFYSSTTGTLAFSSDGGWGRGRLDIFTSVCDADGGWSAPRNLGAPFSSYGDDAICAFLDGGDVIHFASTRSDLPGHRGRYDLFVAVRSR